MIINPYLFGVALDPDAQAFLTATGITDATITSAINTLVLDLKANNLWSKMYAIYPFVGGTSTTHKYNLKNPIDSNAAYRLTFSGGWTHSSTGITGNGVNTYANTNLGMQILPQNNAHNSVYCRTDSTGNYVEMGVYATAQGFYSLLCCKLSNNFTIRLNSDASNSNISNTDAKGFYQIFRTDGVKLSGKKDTASETSFARASVSPGIYTNTYLIGDFNFNGAPYGYYTNRELAFASLGEGYSNIDATNFRNVVQTFQTTLGRQI